MTAKSATTASSEPLAAGQGTADARTELELYLAETRQLFNSMDPAPFRERDLDPKAAAYIIDWAREAPSGRVLQIVLCEWWPILAEAQFYDRPGVMDVRLPGTGATVST